MAVRIVLTHNLKDIPFFLTKVSQQAVKKAVARSIKRTFQGLRTQAGKMVRERQWVNTRTLPSKRIKGHFIKEQESTRASLPVSRMGAQLEFTDRRPGLIHFFARTVRTGQTARRRRPLYGAQATVMGKTFVAGKAFIPKNRKGAILARVGSARLPVRKLFGPSFAFIASKTGVADELQRSAQERYKKEFEGNLQFYLKSLSKRR